MKFKVVFLLTVFTISLGTFSQTKTSLFTKNFSNAMEFVEKGKNAIEKKDIEKAKKLFKKAIKQFDRTYQAYAYLGIIASMEKDYPTSLNYFKESLKQFERYKTHILERKKDYMLKFKTKATELRSVLDNHDMQYLGLNATEYESRYTDYKNKAKNLEEELKKDKDMKYDAFFRFKYGNVLMATKNREYAKQQYQLAIDANPNFKDAYANLAVCYFLDGDCNNAMQIYKKGKQLGTKFHPKFEQDLLKRCK